MAPQVGLEPTTTRLTAECSAIELLRNIGKRSQSSAFLMESGGDLPSRAVSSQVLSALKGLTSVFGMGTGGTPSPLPPEIISFQGAFRLYLDNCTDFLKDFQPHCFDLASVLRNEAFDRLVSASSRLTTLTPLTYHPVVFRGSLLPK